MFAKLAEKRNLEDLIANVGAGGGAAAVAVAAPPAGGGGGGAAAPPPAEEKKKVRLRIELGFPYFRFFLALFILIFDFLGNFAGGTRRRE